MTEILRLTDRAVEDEVLASDRVAFMEKVGGQLMRRKIDPDPWQKRVLASDAKRKILNTSRQIGKSSVVAALSLHQAVYTPETDIYLFAPTEKQAKETFAKIGRFYLAYQEADQVGRLRRAVLYGDDPVRNVRKMSLTLPNGSRIQAMPATDNSSRGFTADLLIIDEAAFASDAFYDAITPSLAVSDGDLILASTPNGKRGFYYQEWEEGEDWDRHRIPATECPRITPEFLAQELHRKGERHWKQEYMTEFVETEDSVFQSEVIAAAFDADVEPLWLD